MYPLCMTVIWFIQICQWIGEGFKICEPSNETNWGLKITGSWDIAPCNLAEVCRLSRDAFCLHHQGSDGLMSVIMDVSSMYETSVKFYPEDTQLHTRHRENQKSRQIEECALDTEGGGGDVGTSWTKARKLAGWQGVPCLDLGLGNIHLDSYSS